MPALSDPILEAAARILATWDNSPRGFEDGLRDRREYVDAYSTDARAMILEAARQVDALRKAGVIPEGEE